MSDTPEEEKPEDVEQPEDEAAESPTEDEEAEASDAEGGDNAQTDVEAVETEETEEEVVARVVERKRKLRRRKRIRQRIVAVFGSLLLIGAITCGKVLVRTELRDPQRLAKLEQERRAKLAPGEAEFSDIEYEMMGFIAGSIPVVPPASPSATERYRDFEQVARIVTKRPDNTVITAAELKAERERIAAMIPRQPFVVYVAVAAVIHFILGFLCAMHLGYRPRIFGVRWSLKELDPFVTDDFISVTEQAIETPVTQAEEPPAVAPL